MSLSRNEFEDLTAFCARHGLPDYGRAFFSERTAKQKKEKGQVETPEQAVAHALDLLPETWVEKLVPGLRNEQLAVDHVGDSANSAISESRLDDVDFKPLDLNFGRLLDLGCGTGNFLLAAYRRLKEIYVAAGFSTIEAHEHLLNNVLYGLDSDPLAIAVARCRLRLECPESSVSPAHLYQLNAYHLFTHPLGSERFDVIVGNPPWGSRLDAEDRVVISQYFHLAAADKQSCNSFVLFLEATLRLLAPEGVFSLLLPASFLNIKTYATARRYLLTKSKLHALHYVPQLFPGFYAPAVFISGTRTDAPKSDHEVRLLPHSHTWSGHPMKPESRLYTTAPQSQFAQSPDAILNIHFDPDLHDIFARMDTDAFYLVRPHVRFLLGIITGDNKRKVYHHPPASHDFSDITTTDINKSSCGVFDDVSSVSDVSGDASKLASNGVPTTLPAALAPLYTADDVSRFHLQPPSHFLHDDPATLQQAAPKRRYQSPEKLLYKFISKELIVAIDRTGSYTLNNTNCILPLLLPRPVTTRYIAALLNSTLLNTYYLYHFFTAKVTTHNLSRLPLKHPTPEQATIIDSLASQLEATPVDSALWQQLNTAVYELYDLTSSEQHTIQSAYDRLRTLPFV